MKVPATDQEDLAPIGKKQSTEVRWREIKEMKRQRLKRRYKGEYD